MSIDEAVIREAAARNGWAVEAERVHPHNMSHQWIDVLSVTGSYMVRSKVYGEGGEFLREREVRRVRRCRFRIGEPYGP